MNDMGLDELRELVRNLAQEVRAARNWDDEMRAIGSGHSLGPAMDEYRRVRKVNQEKGI